MLGLIAVISCRKNCRKRPISSFTSCLLSASHYWKTRLLSLKANCRMKFRLLFRTYHVTWEIDQYLVHFQLIFLLASLVSRLAYFQFFDFEFFFFNFNLFIYFKNADMLKIHAGICKNIVYTFSKYSLSIFAVYTIFKS